MRFRNLILVVIGTTIALHPKSAAANELNATQSVEAEVDQIKQARLADATEVAIYSPVVSWSPTSDTTLYLLNTYSETLAVDVTFLPVDGPPKTLSGVTIDPNRHTTLSLKDAFAGRPVNEGSIRVAFHGDTNMLQSWAILRRQDQTLEIRLTAPTPTANLHLVSFWDTSRRRGSDTPRFYFLNTSSNPVVLTFTEAPAGGDPERSQSRSVTLQSMGRAVISPRYGSSDGWARVESSSDGSISAVGLLEAPRRVAALPLQPIPDAEPRISSLPFDVGPGLWPNTITSLFNPSSTTSHARVDLLGAASDTVLASITIDLAPSSSHTVDLRRDLWQAFARGLADRARLVISADTGLLLSGYTDVPPGSPVDLVFAPEDYAHQNGTYAIPNLQDFDVYTDFVNVSAAPARIRGQLSWEGGVYALSPFVVDPGASYRLRYSDLATAPSDLLGRTAPAAFQHGFFQWSAHGSEGMLLARTHVRPRSGADSWGFNCYGCCWEIPQGLLVPDSVSFDIGGNPQFTASELDNTCSGSMGPFPAQLPTLTFHAPVSWNGSNASSSGYTSQTVSFASPASKVSLICVSSQVTIRGTGPLVVDKCYHDNHPGGDPGRGCNQQTGACGECYSCCEADKEVAKCRCVQVGGNPQTCAATAAAACGSCKQQCFGTFAESCSTQVTSCQP